MTPRWLGCALLLGTAACAAPPDDASQDYDVKLDTESDLAWAQYQANRAFAEGYEPRCELPEVGSDRPRVIVSGFGRFKSNAINATGLMVSELLPELDYPLTESPPAGQIDPPGPQLAVGTGVVELPQAGEVEVCAMVLPVFWDLAALILLREIERFAPDVVVMNGVSGSAEDLWIELGAVNRATRSRDGSNILEPLHHGSALVPEASDDDYARGNLASWLALREAAESAIEEVGAIESETSEGEVARFDEVLGGALFAGYPRTSNIYLCNNTTYTVGYALDHPGEPITLMEASDPRGEPVGGLELVVGASSDEAAVLGASTAIPRWFMHWPRVLREAHLEAGAAVLRRVIEAQLLALAEGKEPERGDNALAEILPSL